MTINPRAVAILRWVGIGLGAVVILLVLVLAFIDWNLLKHPIERVASAKSGRSVTISGPLDVHIWSWTPSIQLSGLTVGNPPWESARPMARVESLQVQFKWLPLLKGQVILPRVAIVHPQIYLHRDAQGRANWTFENTKPTNAKASSAPKLPVVRDFLVERGELRVLDDIAHLDVTGSVQAHEKRTDDDPKAFKVQAHGTLNKEPFSTSLSGGPLINLDPDRPYPFDLQIRAGTLRVQSNGRFRKPFDVGQVSLNVKGSGKDLADLFYLTQLALPNTPPFTLEAAIDRDGNVVKVTGLHGTVGASDLGGELKVDLSRKRARIDGTLESKQLRLRDLAASLGGQADKNDKPDLSRGAPGMAASAAGKTRKGAAKDKAPPADPNARLFPDAHLQVDRVRAMDGDVRFTARSIDAGSVPLKQVVLRVKLDEGVLSLDPFDFEMPQGRLHGKATIDARGTVPATHIDARLSNIQLAQLKGKAPDATPPLDGIMQARAVLDGRGDSVHALMADANGKLTIVLPRGEIRSAFAELTGINVANGLGLLLKGSQDKAGIRCGVAQFDVKDGDMRAQSIVIDTDNVLISGDGNIRLGPEEIAMSIKGEPKKLRLARLRTPIKIGGHLLDPSVGVDVGKTLKQGAVATALGTLVTPLAALIAFVDPGLAKDADCASLLQAAHAASGGTVPTAAGEPQGAPH